MDFKEIILNNYGGIRVKADIDEKPEDIIAAIFYNDHGDDYLLIKTKEYAVKYGWFCNRPLAPDYDQLDVFDGYFIKRPKLNGIYDRYCHPSNQLISRLEEHIKDRIGIGTMTQKCYSKSLAQLYFDSYINYAKTTFEAGAIYHLSEYPYIETIERYLKENDIYTEDNLKKVTDCKKYFRIDAVDGSAGKILSNYAILGDNIYWIYYKNQFINKKYKKHGITVKSCEEHTEWGDFDQFTIALEQFV